MRDGEGGVVVDVVIGCGGSVVLARWNDDTIGHGGSIHEGENGELRRGAATTGEGGGLEKGITVSEEAGAGGGVDVTAALRAHNGAFPAINSAADDARRGGGGRRGR